MNGWEQLGAPKPAGTYPCGHERTGENTSIHTNKGCLIRRCKTCHYARLEKFLGVAMMIPDGNRQKRYWPILTHSQARLRYVARIRWYWHLAAKAKAAAYERWATYRVLA